MEGVLTTLTTKDGTKALIPKTISKGIYLGTTVGFGGTLEDKLIFMESQLNSALQRITVLESDSETIAVTGITLNKANTTVSKGSTETLVATIEPSNATNKTVIWSSSNSSIATVNNGIVSGVNSGSCVITVTSVDGSKTATCNVTVETATISVISIALNKTASNLAINGTEQLTVTFNPTNASNKTVIWTSSDETKATVVNGFVTAKAEGDVTITATSQDGSKTATCIYTITIQAQEQPVKLENLKLWLDGKEHGTSVNTWFDNSGNSNHAQFSNLTNNGASENGWYENGLKLKLGSSQKGTVQAKNYFYGIDNGMVSYEWYCKYSATKSKYAVMSGEHTKNIYSVYQKSLDGGKENIFTDYVNNTKLGEMQLTEDYQLVHVVITYDFINNVVKHYFNGVLVNTYSNINALKPTISSVLTIGSTTSLTGYNYFEGTIYTCRIYDAILSDEDIVYNYNLCKRRFG